MISPLVCTIHTVDLMQTGMNVTLLSTIDSGLKNIWMRCCHCRSITWCVCWFSKLTFCICHTILINCATSTSLTLKIWWWWIVKCRPSLSSPSVRFLLLTLSFCVCFRITLNGMKVSRPDVRIGRYRMIKHERDKHNEPNPQRYCVTVRSCCSSPRRPDRSAPLLSHNYTDDPGRPILSPLDRVVIMQHCKGCTINHLDWLLVLLTDKYTGIFFFFFCTEEQHSCLSELEFLHGPH